MGQTIAFCGTCLFSCARQATQTDRLPHADAETPLIPDFKVGSWGYWSVLPQGIYFVQSLVPHSAAVKFYDFDRRSIRLITNLSTEPPFDDSGFSVSPDGRWILYTQVDHSGSDIMLVEQFH